MRLYTLCSVLTAASWARTAPERLSAAWARSSIYGLMSHLRGCYTIESLLLRGCAPAEIEGRSPSGVLSGGCRFKSLTTPEGWPIPPLLGLLILFVHYQLNIFVYVILLKPVNLNLCAHRWFYNILVRAESNHF